ncbi:hypothetical protein [Flavilitoribacter nigricans]|uniref:hypothetical protein n=1 Tax=Flavilitoribacter nigricans TaxID=70997 RepID=UPI00117B4B8F|nr:hypothetical protein [Flavilitoribacter nigricans]
MNSKVQRTDLFPAQRAGNKKSYSVAICFERYLASSQCQNPGNGMLYLDAYLGGFQSPFGCLPLCDGSTTEGNHQKNGRCSTWNIAHFYSGIAQSNVPRGTINSF